MIFTTRTNGLTYHGTNAERLASFPQPRREGLEFHETDTDALYKVVKGEWVGIGGGGGGTHNIVGVQHTVVGSQWDVVGLTGVNTLGLLTPSSDPGENPSLLVTNSDGYISLASLGIGMIPDPGSFGIYFGEEAVIESDYSLELTVESFSITAPDGFQVESDDININPTSGVVMVNGGLRIANTTELEAGNMRWTGTDFEGYDGTNWLSLTATGGAAGEANTASNVGTGDGWFKQKTGVNLEFLSLLTTDAITKTVGADEITIGLNQSQINHTNLLNIGTNSHDQIDTHIASTSNPHSVTYGQVGAAPTTHSHVEADITDLNHLDVNAIHDNVAGEIVLIAEKATPVSADIIIIEDSADGNNKKRVQIGNLPGGGSGSSTFLGLSDTINSYTSGRVLFESGSGVVDDGELYWDNTNKRLGIGTTSPASVLEVDGNDTSDVIFRDAALKFYDATTLRWTLHNAPTSSPYSADTSIHISYSNDAGGSFPFNAYGNIVLQGRSDNSSYGGLAIFTGVSPTDPSFVVLPSGNVGVGTSSPLGTLHIGSGGNLGSTPTQSNSWLNIGNSLLFDTNQIETPNTQLYINYGSSTNISLVAGGGKVGIGTTAPYDQCHIRGENAKIRIGHNANNAGEVGVNFSHVYTVNVQQKTAIVSKAIGTWGRSDLHFVLNSAGDITNYSVPTDTKMIILNNGNVGIGTTAPNSRLHVHKVTTQNSTQEFATYSYLGAVPTSSATVGYEGVRGYAESNASVYIPTITGGVFYGDLGSSGDVNDLRGLEAYAKLTGSGHATNANGIKIDIFRNGSGTIGTAVGLSIANINEGSANYAILTNGGTVKIGASGLVVGNPTGGDKGTGTINAQAVYDDNTLLTDYVFEPEYNLLSIDQTTSFYKKNYHLPTIFGRDEWEREGGYSLGKLVSQLWETVEVQAIHITQLNERLKQLEV